MKRILRSRLPERFADRVPPLLVEIIVGTALAAMMTFARVALVPITGDRAPDAFVFVAVVGSAVLAGWRSGLLALLLGQWLVWTLIADTTRIVATREHLLGGLAVSSLAQLVSLAIIALYQREIDRASREQKGQIESLDRVMREIDHRTKNNYQTMLAVVLAQAKAAQDPAVKETLHKISDRLRAIGEATARLVHSSESLESVRLGEHLRQLCAQIEQGLFRSGIRMDCKVADVSIDVDRATSISILVNELVTNALKHAFPGDREGQIRVSLEKSDGGLLLEVADDGVGMNDSARTRSTGLGARLVEAFTKQLGARYEVETGDGGTRHRIHLQPAA